MLRIIFLPAVFLSFLSCLHICFKRRETGTDALDFGITLLMGWDQKRRDEAQCSGMEFKGVSGCLLLPDLRGNPGPSLPLKQVLTADANADSNQTFEAGNEI